jgi:RNA polymerase sigma-70 factor (ECF subfamily)
MDFGSSAHFPTTDWTALRATKDRRDPGYLEAMNRCMAAYWKPVFYFLRSKGCPLHEAEDLTQEFFLQFFHRHWIRRADPERGRFRTFLLTILTRFLADQRPPRARRQTAFDDRLVSISALMGDRDRGFEPPANETPEEVFMKQWARAVIDNVRRGLQRWCEFRGRPDWYEVFSAHYFPPPGSARVTQNALADRFRLTRDQVRYALEEVNRQFIEFLRSEVGRQVDSPAELEAEIDDLQRLLGG